MDKPVKLLFRDVDPVTWRARAWPWKYRGPRNRIRCRRPSRLKYRVGCRYPVFFERVPGPFPTLHWYHHTFDPRVYLHVDLAQPGTDHTVVTERTP